MELAILEDADRLTVGTDVLIRPHSFEAVAKPPLHVDAFVSNASDKDGLLHIDAIETIASTGFATASLECEWRTREDTRPYHDMTDRLMVGSTLRVDRNR